MTTLKALKREILRDSEILTAYEANAPEYEIVRALIAARRKAGLTQDEMAKKMGTQQASIARIESGRHMPSLRTIERYAAATGHKVALRLEPG